VNQGTLEASATFLKQHILRNVIFLRVTIAIAQSIIVLYVLFNFSALTANISDIFNMQRRKIGLFSFILYILAKVAHLYTLIFWIFLIVVVQTFKNWQSQMEQWARGVLEHLVSLQNAHKTLKIWLNIFCWGPVVGLSPLFIFIALFSPDTRDGYENTIDRGAGVCGLIILMINWLIIKSIYNWVIETAKVVYSQPPPINLPKKYLAVSTWLILFQIAWVCLVFGVWVLASVLSRSPNGIYATTTIIFASIYILIGLILESSRRFAGYLTRYMMLLYILEP
jgi:hypothetical protein